MTQNAVLFTIEEAAELADIKPALLKHWLETGKFKSSSWTRSEGMGGPIVSHYFNEADITALVQFAKVQHKQKPTKEDPFVDDGKQQEFTVAQIASMWHLSTDKVQRDFENEPDVQVLGNRNPRGKRKRLKLIIPRHVMERVKKRRSNPV
jgi:hypothetical protein